MNFSGRVRSDNTPARHTEKAESRLSDSAATSMQRVMMLAAENLLPGHTRYRRVSELLITLWILSIMDLCFTLWAHRFTPFIELNPLAGALLGRNLVAGVVLYKLTLMLIATAIFWRLRNSGRTEFALWGLVLVYTLLMFRWADYTVEASNHIAVAGFGEYLEPHEF